MSEIPPELMQELGKFLQGIGISLLFAGILWRMGDRLYDMMDKRGWL